MANKLTNTILSKLFEMTPHGVKGWRDKNKTIIDFFEKYFDKETIEEYLSTNKIKKFDNYNFFDDIIYNQSNIYIDHFKTNFKKEQPYSFLSLYFKFFKFIKINYKSFEKDKSPLFAAFAAFSLQNRNEIIENEVVDFVNILRKFDKYPNMWLFLVYVSKNDFIYFDKGEKGDNLDFSNANNHYNLYIKYNSNL